MADQLRALIRYGLFDDSLTVDELINLFEVVGGVVAFGALAVATAGGSAALVGLLAVTAAASEGSAVFLSVVDGQYVRAAVGVTFLIVDVDSLGQAGAVIADAIRSGRLANRLSPLLQLRNGLSRPIASSSDQVLAAVDDTIRQLQDLGGADDIIVDLRAIGNQWELRPASVFTTTSENAAYIEAVTRDALVEQAIASGANRQLAEDIVEQTFVTGRSALNEAEFVRVRDFLEANPNDGEALFASRGIDAVNNPAAARRYADLCLNSFAGDTLVVLADGSRVPISELHVGARVAAFDVGDGVVSSGVVTAVLSHTDEVFDVELSDGSVLSVTEDHRFYDPANTAWAPIGDLAGDGGVLLGLGGANVLVNGLDDRSGASVAAWDISVAGVHNFYVAADYTSVPVLVHNASDFCALPITLGQFDTLARITDPVEAAAVENLLNRFGPELSGLDAERFESIVRTFVDFAGTNVDDAIRLASDVPDWVVAAANGSPEFFSRALTRRVSGLDADLYYRAVLPEDLFRVAENARTQGLSLARTDDLVTEAADPQDFLVLANGSKARTDPSFTRVDQFNGSATNGLPNVLLPNQSYVRNGYEYVTDDLGRVVEARASVLRFEPDTATNSYTTEVGNLGGSQYEGGHLIGRRFGGFAEGVTLSPQLRTVNNGAYKAMEDGWAAAINPAVGGTPGAITNVRVRAVYTPGNNSLAPDSYIVSWDQAGIPRSLPFQN